MGDEGEKPRPRAAATGGRARLRARDSLRQLETLQLVEAMTGVGYWRLDLDTLKVSWSDEVFRIHGVCPETFEPSSETVVPLYHPEDREELKARVGRTAMEGAPYEFKLRIFRPDGALRTVLSRGAADRDKDGRICAAYGVFQDVTEAEAATQRLKDSEARFRLLAHRATDVIAVYGLDGVFTYLSPSIRQVTGYAAEEMIGRRWDEFMHPADVAPTRAAFMAYVGAGPEATPPRIPYRAIRKDGAEVWLEAHPILVRDAAGRPVELQDLVRDITDTKRLEDQLTEARDRAEAGARAQSEFLANMSHELRTPLTAVVGFSNLLKASQGLGPTERGYVDRIATASDALLSVINDILDYSKLEAEAVDLDPQAFCPAAMIEGAASIVEGQRLAKGLGLVTDVEGPLPTALMGDEGRLRQVTLNFLSNAVKFTAAGRIRLGVRFRDGRLRVAVTDTGIGVAPEKINQLFRRFSQADASTTRVYGGTGLGLAISRRLIEMMGGEVGAQSAPGVGSTFWFEVPLAQAEGWTGETEPAAAPLDRAARILMADDAAANRELVGAILGGLGVELTTVCDGAAAVEAASTGDFDLILMDVHMPVMDGLHATRAIRALPGEAGRTPIVALTANVQPAHVQACLAAGMDGHLGKPIQVPALMAAIAGHLARREAERSAA